jgi:hypothetical protein
MEYGWTKSENTFDVVEDGIMARDVNNQANQAELASYSKLLTYTS